MIGPLRRPRSIRSGASRTRCGSAARKASAPISGGCAAPVGRGPNVGQRRSGGVGAFGTITGLFPLDCGAAAPGRYDLVMDMYHEEHRERAAPPGFAIDPL